MSEEEIKDVINILNKISEQLDDEWYRHNRLIYKIDEYDEVVSIYKYINQLQQENKELNKRIDETLNLINEIRNLEYDKFCNYNTYLNSLNDIYLTLKGEK